MPHSLVQLFALLNFHWITVLALKSPGKLVHLDYATYQSDLSLENGVTSFLGIQVTILRLQQAKFSIVHISIADLLHYCAVGSPGSSTTSPFSRMDMESSAGVCVPEPFRISWPKNDVGPYNEDLWRPP
ncbi:hypothetical protein C8J57DRAFT_1273034 [Mycena rebaudengoi]|nr:hypothetical protein C8J57DRAFT_1273034 [Mycena rebaudengoi]